MVSDHFEPPQPSFLQCRSPIDSREKVNVRDEEERKRPADLAFLGRFAREMVCPLTGKLRGRHDDGYGSSRS